MCHCTQGCVGITAEQNTIKNESNRMHNFRQVQELLEQQRAVSFGWLTCCPSRLIILIVGLHCMPRQPQDANTVVPAFVGGKAAPEACQKLLTAVSHTPGIPLALRSLVSNPPPPQQVAPAAANPADLASQPQLATQAQSAEQQKHAMIIQMTMHAALRPLTAHVPASSASTSGKPFWSCCPLPQL